ncbi:MAG: putative tellurite resistance protein B-like protein, partial [Gammaproteobacteria bacterium]
LADKAVIEATPTKTIEFAAAVLMFEISRADSSVDDEERKVIDNALLNHFNMSKTETEELLLLAEKEVDHSVSLHEFTRAINESLSQEDKIKIVELLWRVAFADAVLDKYEEYFIRKIADLLYVSHKDYIQSKHRAASG